MTDGPVRRAGPGSGRGGAPSAIALSPILSARYRARDLERIRAAAPDARLVMVSVEGLADGPIDDVEVLLLEGPHESGAVVSVALRVVNANAVQVLGMNMLHHVAADCVD